MNTVFPYRELYKTRCVSIYFVKNISQTIRINRYQFIYSQDNFPQNISSLLIISFLSCRSICTDRQNCLGELFNFLDMRVVTFWQASYPHQTSAASHRNSKNELIDKIDCPVVWTFDWNIREGAEIGCGTRSADGRQSRTGCGQHRQWRNSSAALGADAVRSCVDGDGNHFHRSVRLGHQFGHLPVAFEECQD